LEKKSIFYDITLTNFCKLIVVYFLDSIMSAPMGKIVYLTWTDEMDSALLAVLVESITTMVIMLKMDGSHMSTMLL